jgi:hypothetical protein
MKNNIFIVFVLLSINCIISQINIDNCQFDISGGILMPQDDLYSCQCQMKLKKECKQ